MLYILFSNLVDTFSFFNVFKYLTVRTGLSMFTAMIVVFIAGGPFIRYFSSKKIHNPIRDDGPDEHIVKKIGTPTMGGLLIFQSEDPTARKYIVCSRYHQKGKYDMKLLMKIY